MNLTSTTRDGIAVVSIEGRFTASGAPQLRDTVSKLISAGTAKIVVDLGATSFIDSSGLGALIGGLKSARVAGGDLRIASVPEQVRSVLRLTNLDRVLGSYATPEAAFNGR